MRSFGTTSFFIVKIFIYESLILVISSSICGLLIGTIVGNLMQVQQAMIMSYPCQIVVPLDQLYTIMGISVVIAVGSTYRAARSLVSKNIPNITRG